jgi:hypothetical protein
MIQGLVRQGHRRGGNVMILESFARTALAGASCLLYDWQVADLVTIYVLISGDGVR